MIFDKGANSIADNQMIRADNLQYITGKKINKSDDTIIAEIEICNIQVIDKESGIYRIKIENPENTYYLNLSKNCRQSNWNPKLDKSFVRKGGKGHSGKY